METKVDVRLPMAVNEAVIKRHYAKERGEIVADDVLDGMADAALVARESAKRALDSHERITRNPMKTPLANARESRDTGFKHFEIAAKKLDVARDKAERAISYIATTTASPPEPKTPADAFQRAEIRSALAAMSPEQRTKAISEAIDNDDDDILSACFVGPVFLTGLGQAERAAMRERWRRRKFPADIDRQQRLKAALTDLDRMQATLLTFIDKMTDAEEIKRAEDAEKLALASKVA